MATYTANSGTITFSGTGSLIRSISFSDLYTEASKYIPKYSTIKSVSLKAYIRETTNKIGSADFYVFFGNDSNSSIHQLYYGNGKIPKNNKSDLEVPLDLTGNAASNTSTAGRISYSGATRLCFRCQSSLVSRNYQLSFIITFDYEPPQFNINVVVGEGGIVSGGSKWSVTTTDRIVTLTAKPNDGYKFVKWVDNNGKIYTDITVTINVSHNNISAHETTVTYTAYFELDKINKIYVDTSQPTGIYVDETNKKIVFVVNGTVSTPNSSAFDMWDGYHIVVQNSIPSGMEEIREVYVDTTKVYG